MSRNVTILQNVTKEENVTTEVTCPSLQERNVTMQVENYTTHLVQVPVRVNTSETVEVSAGTFANVSCSHVEYEWQDVTSLENVTVVRSVRRTFFVTSLLNITRQVNFTYAEEYTVNFTRTEFQPIAELRAALAEDIGEQVTTMRIKR